MSDHAVRGSAVEVVRAWYPGPCGEVPGQSWVLTCDKDGRFRTYFAGHDGAMRVASRPASPYPTGEPNA